MNVSRIKIGKRAKCKKNMELIYNQYNSFLIGQQAAAVVRNCRKHLGCYKDDGRRILPKAFVNLSRNSPRKCSRHCRRNQYQFSGVQYTTQCFCGSKIAERAKKISYRRCNRNCPGKRNQKCGGTWAMNVYSGSGRPCKYKESLAKGS